MPNNKQLGRIHALKSKLGIDDPEWRSLLAQYGVTTSANLNNDQFKELHDFLEKDAIAKKVWEKKTATRVSAGFANVKQKSKIRNMWDLVTTQKTDEDKKKALNKFILRIARVHSIEWLPIESVQKVIKALSVMVAKKESKNVSDNK